MDYKIKSAIMHPHEAYQKHGVVSVAKNLSLTSALFSFTITFNIKPTHASPFTVHLLPQGVPS